MAAIRSSNRKESERCVLSWLDTLEQRARVFRDRAWAITRYRHAGATLSTEMTASVPVWRRRHTFAPRKNVRSHVLLSLGPLGRRKPLSKPDARPLNQGKTRSQPAGRAREDMRGGHA
jgi:hypothetical protein